MSFILYIGPMYASKTSRLIMEMGARGYGVETLILINDKDTRYSEEALLVTHSGQRVPAVKVDTQQIERVRELVFAKDYGVIGLDELHFYGPEVAELIRELVAMGKCVIATGINSESLTRRPHPTILECMPHATQIHVVQSKCNYCLIGWATYTLRTDLPLLGTDVKKLRLEELIGGKEKYAVACPQCYSLMLKEAEKNPEHYTPTCSS